MIRLPIHILMWLLFLVVKIPVALLGLLVTPLLWRYRHTNYAILPFWTRPWANPEDWRGPGNMPTGSLPKWWYLKEGSSFKSWYRYHAIRNPANGLRSFELFDLTIDPNKMRFVRSKNFGGRRYDISTIRDAGLKTVWYYAWQGWQSGFEFIHIWNEERHFNIKFGWRVEPSDKEFYVANLGSDDASFASKILPYRKG